MRDKEIIKVSVVGILTNILLAGAKAVIGILAGSIAIVLDAVNNLSDVLSSTITIIGMKLAGKKPDKEHPLGHGRIEYVSAATISIIVIYAGVTSLVESIKKIVDPTLPKYSVMGMGIIAVAVVVKVVLGCYVKSKGKKLNSGALIASGQDATMDALISASTLLAAVIFIIWELNLEAYLGVLISLFIVKSGYDILQDTISQIIGERVHSDLTDSIKKTITSFPDVYGAYDLILHNYGPDTYIGSVHIEVPDTYTVDKLDLLEREIADKVYEENQVIMAGISVYSYNTQNEMAKDLQAQVRRLVMAHDDVLQLHGFYVDDEKKNMRFDIIIDYDTKDREASFAAVLKEVEEAFPEYAVRIVLDDDISN